MYKQIEKLLIVSVALGAAISVAAQDEAPIRDDSSERCIAIRAIRHTEVIDDRNILFHMRGDLVYHNILSHRCGGLAREDRFSYRTTIGRLCNHDQINVLYRDPYGFREGAACGLGQFHRMTRDDAKAFKEESNKPPPSKPLPMPQPQEVGGDKNKPEE